LRRLSLLLASLLSLLLASLLSLLLARRLASRIPTTPSRPHRPC
jgi:hypothetical protein